MYIHNDTELNLIAAVAKNEVCSSCYNYARLAMTTNRIFGFSAEEQAWFRRWLSMTTSHELARRYGCKSLFHTYGINGLGPCSIDACSWLTTQCGHRFQKLCEAHEHLDDIGR